MPQIFSQEQHILLTAVLNRLVPAEGNMPGAGDLGLGRFVEDAVASKPEMVKLFSRGLSEIEIAGSSAGAFGQCRPSEQDAVLKSVEQRETEFFEELVRQAYNGYYTNARVFEAIGFSPQSAAPGATPALLDESLLDKQRQRAPFWTPTDPIREPHS